MSDTEEPKESLNLYEILGVEKTATQLEIKKVLFFMLDVLFYSKTL